MKALTAILGALVLGLTAGLYHYYNVATNAEHSLAKFQRSSIYAKSRVTSLEQENALFNEILDNLRHSNDLLSTQLAQKEKVRKMHDSQMEELRDKNAALNRKVTDLSVRIEDLEKRKYAIATELAEKITGISKKKGQEIAELNSTAQKTEQELQRMRATHDELVSGMKKVSAKGQINITHLADRLSVSMAEKILFPSGSSEITPEGLKVLKRIGEIIKSSEDRIIQVEGHTDNETISWFLRGKYPTNWELSAARATTVVRFLQDRIGINGAKLNAVGLSEYHPVADNKTPEGRSRNRRIEIALIKAPSQ